MEPFVQKLVPEPPLVNRALRIPDPDAAEIAVMNLFAAARDVGDITRADLAPIAERYRLGGADTPWELAPAGRTVFTQLLTHYVADGELSDDEVDSLVLVKELFDLTNREARALHDDAAAEHYRLAIDERLVDRVISEADRTFLDRLRDRLLLSDERARQVTIEGAQAILEAAEQQVSSDLTLSPSDAASLAALAESLGLGWMEEATDRERIDRLRRHWELDRLPLSAIEANFTLASGEVAYLEVPDVHWRDLPPPGPNDEEFATLNADLIAFLEWLFTTIGDWLNSTGETNEDGLRTVDTGRIAVTNQHLLFIGHRRTEVTPLANIRDVQHAPSRISARATGRPWPLVFDGNEELAAAFVLLRRLIREDIAARTD